MPDTVTCTPEPINNQSDIQGKTHNDHCYSVPISNKKPKSNNKYDHSYTKQNVFVTTDSTTSLSIAAEQCSSAPEVVPENSDDEEVTKVFEHSGNEDASPRKARIQYLESALAEKSSKLRQLQRENRTIKSCEQTLTANLRNFLAEDQIQHLNGNKSHPWSSDTTSRGLKLRAVTGKNGYAYLRKDGFPEPSYRTLCEKVEILHMAPGIQVQLMELLELKTKEMLPREKLCVLLVDEVQL